jgi:hypothetical protein
MHAHRAIGVIGVSGAVTAVGSVVQDQQDARYIMLSGGRRLLAVYQKIIVSSKRQGNATA